MPLHQKKRRQRPASPELVTGALIAVAVVAAGLWLYQSSQRPWVVVEGRVVHGSVAAGQYHQQDTPYRVSLSYEYEVQGNWTLGRWDGFWPKAHSPNALLPADLSVLKRPGYPLTVAYDPTNPVRSSLHGQPRGLSNLYSAAAAGALLLLVVYAIGIYPRWKFRQSHQFVRA